MNAPTSVLTAPFTVSPSPAGLPKQPDLEEGLAEMRRFSAGLRALVALLCTFLLVAGESRLNTVNALKNLNSLVLSWLSVAAFVVAGAIAWKEGVLMMLAATAGGFFGARWSKRLPVRWVRAGVIVVGLAMSAAFFWRQMA